MKREKKFKETDTFIYYNANPKNRITGDCSFRAIATGLEQDYNQTVMEMAQHMCKTGYAMNDSKGENSYLTKVKGWIKHSQPKHDNGTKYTGKEFAIWLSLKYKNGEIGNVICHIGGHHTVCIKPTYHGDGFNCRYKIHDIWDSTDGTIGTWWTEQ